MSLQEATYKFTDQNTKVNQMSVLQCIMWHYVIPVLIKLCSNVNNESGSPLVYLLHSGSSGGNKGKWKVFFFSKVTLRSVTKPEFEFD